MVWARWRIGNCVDSRKNFPPSLASFEVRKINLKIFIHTKKENKWYLLFLGKSKGKRITGMQKRCTEKKQKRKGKTRKITDERFIMSFKGTKENVHEYFINILQTGDIKHLRPFPRRMKGKVCKMK